MKGYREVLLLCPFFIMIVVMFLVLVERSIIMLQNENEATFVGMQPR